MEAMRLERRRFLGAAGATVVTAAVGGGALITGPSGAFAVETRVISPGQADALLQMARQLYPHDQFADMYYAVAVEQMDERAAADADFKERLDAGLAGLNEAMGVPFADLSAGNQLKLLEEREDSAFFQDVRGHTLAALYNNEVIMRRFGYEGSSVEHGGYIERGFDDLGWLPELPRQG